jgi:hypothetical protein
MKVRVKVRVKVKVKVKPTPLDPAVPSSTCRTYLHQGWAWRARDRLG